MNPAKVSGTAISRHSSHGLLARILWISTIKQVKDRHPFDTILIVEISKVDNGGIKGCGGTFHILGQRLNIIKRRQKQNNVLALELCRSQERRTAKGIANSTFQIRSLQQTLDNFCMATLRREMQRGHAVQELAINMRPSTK